MTTEELKAEREALRSELERVIAAFEHRTGVIVDVSRTVLREEDEFIARPVRIEVRLP